MSNPAATIPMPGDVAELIGTNAKNVENRSLLLDKFVFHKRWPVVEESGQRGRDYVKWDEASRWSFLRIAEGAEQLLRREANAKRQKANGKNVNFEKKERLMAEAKLADSLSSVRWESKEITELRSLHTFRFLELFRNAYGDRASIRVAQLEGRLAINLADSLIQNAGICLDRLFGLPYIPGSAVKGAARRAALEELKSASGEKQEQTFREFLAVFGSTTNEYDQEYLGKFRKLLVEQMESENQKGAIAFLPAYPVNNAKIVVDLTNVHTPKYYKTGNVEDLAAEQPMPNAFPVVDVGACFAFCLIPNGINDDPNLVRIASRWLEKALVTYGLGAKTSSGYGWFSMRDDILEQIEEDRRKQVAEKRKAAEEKRIAEQLEQAEAERKASLDPVQLAAELLMALPDDSFASFAKELATKDLSQQMAFFHLLKTQKSKRERWKVWNRKKPEIVKTVLDVAAQLQISFP